MNAFGFPTCCRECRLEAFDRLAALVANDAADAVHRLVASGWSLDDAVDHVREGYRTWIVELLGESARFGAEWAAATWRAAA